MGDKKFLLNAAIDPAKFVDRFSELGRVQIRDFLEQDTAQTLLSLMQNGIKWGVSSEAGKSGPKHHRQHEMLTKGSGFLQEVQNAAYASAGTGEYAFQFGSYPLLTAYLERWDPGSLHEFVLEQLNDSPVLDFVRAATGIEKLRKADAQATFYAPGHFLSKHDDSDQERGRRVAYVLNLCPVEWLPDWGGYLNFLDEEGDVVAGWKPRFNSLNLFRVPQLHQVTYVPPFAPAARFAITGWFRDQ